MQSRCESQRRTFLTNDSWSAQLSQILFRKLTNLHESKFCYVLSLSMEEGLFLKIVNLVDKLAAGFEHMNADHQQNMSVMR